MATPKDFKFSNETKNVTSQCKVIIYPWKNDLSDPSLSDAELAEATRIDVSSQIQSVSFSKSLGSPAGNFSITLTNSPNNPNYPSDDWKDIIKRGFWCVIYMSQNNDLTLSENVSVISKSNSQEAKRIRCIGYIDRVGVKGTTLENRAIDIGFTVTGRDFGVIYEDCNIWHNLFKFDKLALDALHQNELNITGNVRIHTAINLVHQLFYFPLNIPGMQGHLNDNKSLLSIGLQWLLPKQMLLDIGFNLSSLTKGTYWGALPGVANLSTEGGNIYPSGAGLAVDRPGDYLSGNAWDQLKRLSIPQYHELFCETSLTGKPSLTFRPIPWGIDPSKYPINKQYITLYKDLDPVITVPAVDLYDFDLGEDDHARYNSFLATVSTTLMSIENNVSLLDGKGFPKDNSASIRRHGFRPMHVTVDSIVKNEELGNGTSDQQNLLEFNEILYDYWNPAVFGESGTVTKLGSNDVKIGHIMKFKNDVPYLSTKRYYIEGYTDIFTVEENRAATWIQQVSLTRGFEEQDLQAKKGFGSRNTPFTGVGEYTPANKGTK